MDPVITARVPAGVRQRGLEVLREIGSTTSELVNAAFAYVIQERELPKPRAAAPEAGCKRLDAQQQLELASFLENIRVQTPQEWNEAPFEQLLDEAMEGRYADFR